MRWAPAIPRGERLRRHASRPRSISICP
jgi:hypothetical protein